VEPTRWESVGVAHAMDVREDEIASWTAASSGGYTPTRRWVIELRDGRTAFAKVATDELTAGWLRDEHRMYSALRGAPFMPTLIGFSDEGGRPVLMLEDFTAAGWPPPWDEARTAAVLECLATLASWPVPPGLPAAADESREIARGWEEIAADFGGDSLLHFDVRSDNLCFRDDRTAVLVDWNLATVGNPQLDVVFWLPSLEAEGGPAPESVLPDADPGLVTACAAFFCARAARPPIPTAPLVRQIQLVQARTALPWAARALGLPPPA
jgi:hypothetical protein